MHFGVFNVSSCLYLLKYCSNYEMIIETYGFFFLFFKRFNLEKEKKSKVIKFRIEHPLLFLYRGLNFKEIIIVKKLPQPFRFLDKCYFKCVLLFYSSFSEKVHCK